MKFTKDQIIEAIKRLPLLETTDFPFINKPKPISLPTKVSNEEILKGLEEVHSDHTRITSQEEETTQIDMVKNKPSPSQEKDFRQIYYKTPVKKLKFKESTTFFSPRFEEVLQELVSDKKYKELSAEEIVKLNTELQNLSTVEFEWKEYHRRSITKEMAHEQFKEEYKQFLVAFESIRSPKEEDLQGQRAAHKFMSHKIGFITHSLIQYLYVKLDFKALEFCKDLTPKQFGEIVVLHIEPKRVFNDLARISIKKAHEKLLNLREESPYKDDVLSISKFELYEEFRKTLVIEIFYAILTYGENSHTLSSEVGDTLSREVQTRIFYKNLLTNLAAMYKQQFLQFSDLTGSILEAFTSSNFFISSVTSTIKKNKSVVQLILPDHIVVEAYRPLKLPSITRPPVLQKKDIDKLVKPLINGQGSLTKSDHLVATLNISRSKMHKVNRLFLLLSQRFFPRRLTTSVNESILSKWLREGYIEIGTEHHAVIRSLDDDSQYLKEKITSTILSLYIANSIITQLSTTHNIALKSFINLLTPCGVTKAENLRFHVAKELENDYISKIIESKYTQSRLFLAQHLKEFPLYITDTLCIRLRMYPREHWLSRTAGSFKHLLQDFHSQRLTLQGLTIMLEGYYTANPDQLSKFKLYLSNTRISNKTGKKILASYFHANPLDFTLIRKPMYFLNLHLALLDATKNDFYTAANLEIDQNASALVILSIVLRSKEMASVCNLTGTDVKTSPYDYIKEKCVEFLESEGAKMVLNTPQYADVCKFLCTSRKLHKYAIMCFCYNQTAMGRMHDFSDKWREEFGYSPNYIQRTGLNIFAAIYPDFVEFVFPNTRRKLEILKSVVDLVCAEAPHLQMRTIDGEVINWAYYSTTYQNRKYYDTVERAHKSFKISVYRERKQEIPRVDEDVNVDFPQNLELDSVGMKRRFLSYFIHSIDASILRRIIYIMKKEHRVSINHLHDCVIIHPNDVSNFYKVIKRIYTSPELYNIVFDGVFDSVSNTLSPESNEKLNLLKKEFISLTSDFKDDISRMNPHNMYSLED